jgi:hypothetical protein
VVGVNEAGESETAANARQAEAQMPAEIPVQIPAETDSNTRTNARQTVQVADSIDLDAAFNYESQLFRLETYKDKKNERSIVKRVVRFVRKRTGYNIGEVTEELAEKLSRRPGKGRTAKARTEAERNRFLAECLAKRLRRTKRGRRGDAASSGQREWTVKHYADTDRGELLQELPDLSQYERSSYVQ